MSSLLIKGMEIPDCCTRCDYIGLNRAIGCDHYTNVTRRADDCPLVEVPTPHGRLIDANALSKKAYHRQTLTTVADMLNDINDAPTVIEAEEEE